MSTRYLDLSMSEDEIPFPILGERKANEDWEMLDISEATLLIQGVDAHDNKALSQYIFNGNIRYGGYGEERSIYSRSENYASESEVRNIHLGLDIWDEIGTKIYSPWPGEIMSIYNNDGLADYGPTLIIKYKIHRKVFHALYGHLSTSSLSLYHEGDKVEAGSLVGYMGNEDENGGWPPHLHFQLIRTLPQGAFDYPGVCSKQDWTSYSTNCPDPLLFLGIVR